MSRSRYDIFLSYRRSEGKDTARAIKETLERRGYRVFLDMDELQDGVFDKRILDAIHSAPIYLILLTEHCLDRCYKEDDWVRMEIDYALSHHKQIIPLNPDKQFKDIPSTIPSYIRDGLSQHQYSAIDTGQLYQVSMDQLISRRLEPVFRHRHLLLGLWIGIPLLLLSVLFLGVSVYRQRHQPYIYHAKGCSFNHVGETTYNRDSALYYFTKAAEMEYAPAQRDLGQLYQFSLDIRNHEDLSFYWLKKAYLNGDTLATAMLGYNYEKGIGIPSDMVEAITLYKEGVDKNDPYAFYLLGVCLCNGKGLKKDYVEGVHLIAQAAAMGNPWGELYMKDAGRWIFSPSYDSISSKYLSLQAVNISDSATTLYLTWHNSQHVGGWMQISPLAIIEDVRTGHTHTIQSLADCRFAPDTTHVAWGGTHNFSLVFPSVSDSCYLLNFIESPSSEWKIWGVSLR